MQVHNSLKSTVWNYGTVSWNSTCHCLSQIKYFIFCVQDQTVEYGIQLLSSSYSSKAIRRPHPAWRQKELERNVSEKRRWKNVQKILYPYFEYTITSHLPDFLKVFLKGIIFTMYIFVCSQTTTNLCRGNRKGSAFCQARWCSLYACRHLAMSGPHN